MTFGDLKTEVFRRLRETEASPVFFTGTDVANALNEAYHEISDASEWFEIWRTIDLRHTRPYYDVRTIFPEFEVLTPGAAFHDDTSRWLIPADTADLDRGILRWARTLGQPQFVTRRGLWWIGYWPIIGAEAGTVRQYATALPPALVDDADVPGFPEPFHLGLVEYALADLWPPSGEPTKGVAAWAAYLGYEAGLIEHVGRRGMVPLRTGHGEDAGVSPW